MYQFIHIETYARKASTNVKPSKPKNASQAAVASKKVNDTAGNTKRNVSDVIGEAIRLEGYCPHVENPEPPTFLLGNSGDFEKMESTIELNIAKQHELKGGKKLRSDAHVLLAGVASFPRQLEQKEPLTYEKWEADTLEFLKKKFGNNLRSVLKHNDEEHPHIHFYVYDDIQIDVKKIHDGYIAASKFPRLSQDAKIAFKDAMREFQTDYYREVGHGVGLLRDGPKRLRETNAVYKAKQNEARERVALDRSASNARADIIDSAAVELKKVTDLRKTIDLEAAKMAPERAALEQRRERLQREGAALDDGWAKARAKLSEIAIRDDKLTLDETANSRREALALAKLREVDQRTKEAEVKHQAAALLLQRAAKTKHEATEAAQAVLEALPHLPKAKEIGLLLQQPELAERLVFLSKSEEAQDLVFMMEHNPKMLEYVRNAVRVAKSLDDASVVVNQDRTDWSVVLQAASKAEERRNEDGLDFSM